MSNLKEFYKAKGLEELLNKVNSNRYLTTQQREMIEAVIKEDFEQIENLVNEAYNAKTKNNSEKEEEEEDEEEDELGEVKMKPSRKMTKEDVSLKEKQEALIQFGYDQTNVRYMNDEILEMAYNSMLNIQRAENPKQ
jgi:hypothetical protein